MQSNIQVVSLLLVIAYGIASIMIIATVEATHWGWIIFLIFVGLLMTITLLAQSMQETHRRRKKEGKDGNSQGSK